MLRSIDLKIREQLQDREFRREWYRVQLAAMVPDLFRDLREDRNLTQKNLADEAGMKQSAVSRFEQSTEANWKFETLVKLAEALDAQIVISLVKHEDLIKKYERREGGSIDTKGSVFEAIKDPPKVQHQLVSNGLFNEVVKRPLHHKEDLDRGTSWNRVQSRRSSFPGEPTQRSALADSSRSRSR